MLHVQPEDHGGENWKFHSTRRRLIILRIIYYSYRTTCPVGARWLPGIRGFCDKNCLTYNINIANILLQLPRDTTSFKIQFCDWRRRQSRSLTNGTGKRNEAETVGRVAGYGQRGCSANGTDGCLKVYTVYVTEPEVGLIGLISKGLG